MSTPYKEVKRIVDDWSDLHGHKYHNTLIEMLEADKIIMREFILEVAKEPYDDSDLVSLMNTLRKRANTILKGLTAF